MGDDIVIGDSEVAAMYHKVRWWPWPRFRFQKFGLKAGNKKHPSALSLSNEETWYTFRQFKLVERRDEERAELASE